MSDHISIPKLGIKEALATFTNTKQQFSCSNTKYSSCFTDLCIITRQHSHIEVLLQKSTRFHDKKKH